MIPIEKIGEKRLEMGVLDSIWRSTTFYLVIVSPFTNVPLFFYPVGLGLFANRHDNNDP